MKGENKGGRPPYDYALMFKIVILQRYYNLGDDSTERVRHFGPVVVHALFRVDPFPLQDAKTIWNFKNELAKGDMVNKLFKKLDNRLDKEGVIIHEGKMADATIVEIPRQRNSREENEQIKAVKCQRIGKKTRTNCARKMLMPPGLKKTRRHFMATKITSKPTLRPN